MDPSQDPIIRRLREQVSDNDRALVEAINARLRLVTRHEGLEQIYGAILDLTKA
jgi:hypothetical protein